MNVNTFLMLFVVLSAVSTVLTEAIKKATQQKFSANLIALIDAFVVGGLGTVFVYIWQNIAFTLPNILVIICMILAIWAGSMIGFDKIKQLIEQLKSDK